MLKTIRELGVKLSLVFDKSKVDVAQKAMTDLASGVKNVALGASAAAASILGLAGAASSNARDLDQTSKAMGVNVEALQELQYAAQVTAGVTKDELNGALEGLSKTLFEARNNNVEAGQTLIRLGIPIDMLTNKSITADQVMLRLADNISKLPDGMYKTALAQQAMGGTGAKLIPLLNKTSDGIAKIGAEGRALGVVLSADMIKKGAEFDRQWTKIWLVMKNITYLIGHELIKYLAPMVTQVQKWLIANRQLIALNLATFFKSVGQALELIFKGTMFLVEGLKYLVNAFGGIGASTRVLTAALLALAFGPFGILGAAIAALFLIIQDMTSKDSLIKEWAASFTNAFPNITKFFKGLIDQILILPERISGAFEMIKTALADLWGYFKKYTLVGQIIDMLDKIGLLQKAAEKISGFFSGLKEKASNLVGAAGTAMTENARERIKSADDRNQAMSTVTPSTTNNNSVSPTQNNHMTANVHVTVPRGTSPADAEKIVSKGTEHGFARTLRAARDQFIGGLAY